MLKKMSSIQSPFFNSDYIIQWPFKRVDEMFDKIFQTDDKILEVDIEEKNNEVVITCNVPGVKMEHIDISCHKNELTITAKNETKKEESTSNYILQERSSGQMSRTIYLPNNISDEITAKLSNGVLTIKASKIEPNKPKQIKVVSS